MIQSGVLPLDHHLGGVQPGRLLLLTGGTGAGKTTACLEFLHAGLRIGEAGVLITLDRITDIVAGAKAGCRTVLVETGQHTSPAIESPEAFDPSIVPDFICDGLLSASDWILKQQ